MADKPAVAGLPEGIDPTSVRIGVAGDEDFELVGGIIYKGKRANAASGVLVKPAEGFTFQPLQIWGGIKELWILGPPNTFMPVKQMETPEMITVTLKLAVTNSSEQKVIDDTLSALKGLPGFLSLDR